MSLRGQGIADARRRLVEFADRLREVASGEVTARAGRKVQAQIDASSRRILSAHVDTGHAKSTAETFFGGSTVRLVVIGYLKYHAWWPFRAGMPPFVLRRALDIFKAEVEAAVAGKASPLALAEEAAEEAAAAKAAAKFKKDIARIYRRSDEYKAKKAAERKARRQAPRAS